MNKTMILESTLAQALHASKKEAFVQELLEETETVRRILQAQTAALLLLQTSYSADLDQVLQTLTAVDGWIAEITEGAETSSSGNSLAAQLVGLIPAFKQTQRDLLRMISTRRTGSSSAAEGKVLFERLKALNARAETLLEGTSVEIRSLKSGCGCANDRFAKMGSK